MFMKTNVALLLLVLLILTTNKSFLYDNLIGRAFSISLIIYLSHIDLSYGMLMAMFYVALSSDAIFEGMDNMNDKSESKEYDKKTNGAQHADKDKDKEKGKLSSESKIKELKHLIDTTPENVDTIGVDKEDIKVSIAPIDSNSIPVDKNAMSSSDNVKPFYVPKI